MSVTVSHLAKRYGTQWAVKDLSFTLQPGEVVGFLGPNGAGKSTTMKMLTGYVPPTSGSATVDGLDVQAESLAVRRRVGYLPEHNPLYLELYVQEFLRFMGRLHQLKGAALTKRVKEVIELTGLGREQHKKLGALSKGYRQRAGLAQALLHDPSVLILDEPTSGLDPNQVQEIRALIRALGQEKTVLFSSHILQEVEAVANRVMVIHLGELKRDAPLAALRAAAGQQVLQVEFAPKTNQSALTQAQLAALSGVVDVTTLGPNRFAVQAEPAVDLRAAVFELSVKHNCPIVALQAETASLEEIFRQLTSGVADQSAA